VTGLLDQALGGVHLATLDRQTITFNSQKIEKLTTPTPVQRRAFELLGATVPLRIA
jgi:hypothetical protein